jgi:hypothetical protein
MPIYDFRDTNTDELFERIFSISAKAQFLKENPHIVPVISSPMIVSGVGSNLGKTDHGWKDLLGSIKKGSGQGNTIKV